MILIVVVVEAVRVPKQDRRTEELEIASLVAVEERGGFAGGFEVVDKGHNLLVVAERRRRGGSNIGFLCWRHKWKEGDDRGFAIGCGG